MAAQIFSLELDKDDLEKLLKRFDAAPDKIQRNATGVALTAGAKAAMAIAKAKAPSCLKSSIKLANRKTYKKYTKKVSLVAGSGGRSLEALSKEERSVVRAAGSTAIDCYPAIWVEFGTYGKRDYKGEEPYAPATLKKKTYSSGRSDSPFWGSPARWIPAKPFLRPALESDDVEKAIARRLGEYLDKKGL